ncbi:MAG: ATP-binding protein [Omnitrophica WOR_2 bacterium]|jgi:signal transduction histidine kinase
MTIYKRFRISIVFFSLAVITCLIIALIFGIIRNYNSPSTKIAEFNLALNHRYSQSQKLLQNISNEFVNPSFDELHKLSKNLPPSVSLFVLQDDKLIFWSDNSIPFNQNIIRPRIFKSSNGYYQQNRIEKGNYLYILLDLIKYDYPYQNDYLKSSFNPIYNLSADIEISLNPLDYKITDQKGETLLYADSKKNQQLSGEQEFLLYGLFLLAFVLLILSVYNYLHKIRISKVPMVILLVVTTVVIRIIQFTYNIPSFFNDFDLFSPLNYASSPFLPSLGDLLTNVFLFTIVSFLAYRSLKSYRINSQKPLLLKVILILVLFALITALYYFSLYLLDTLIINSSFELNLSKILDFSLYSLLAYFVIAMILLSLFYFSFISVRFSVNLINSKVFFPAFILSSTLVWYLFNRNGLYSPQWQELVLFLIYVGLVIAIVTKKLLFPHVTTTTLLILILTSISTFCLYHNNRSKEYEERKMMAIRLSSEQDKIAEYLYSDFEKSILADTTLYNYFMSAWYDPKQEDLCIKYLETHYFNGYWSKYNAQITLCYPDKRLSLKPSDIIIGCSEYFNGIINNITEKTGNKNLYYIRDSYGVNNYIARIPVFHASFQKETASIVIEFTQKYVPKGLGYPELLLDKSFVSFNDMSAYSYAIYSNGELIKNVGDYSYSISEDPFLSYKRDYNFFDKNGYNHLYHIVNNSTSIIISSKNLTLLDKIAPFTYQLIFHVILIFILTTLYRFRLTNRKYPDLKSQLQIMLVAIVLFSSIITGSTTLHNITSLNEKKNKDMLSEKAHSVLIEIEHKLDTVQNINVINQTYLQELLTKFSLVFFSDINLFTTKGNLLATSRPEIFNEGLRSEYMSPEAFNEIAINQRTFFVTNEQIGSYRYLSAYIPFRNKNNKLIAYVNLPFFAREHELRQEISSFLVTFVNVYIILTAFAVFISLIVGNYVTRPLQLIRDQFSHVKLDKKNEKIEYTRHDELGNLINEYNLMLEKLSESVDKLAQSERESAWKEMARQIAHEIKNPLTPMKLSIQHLYRSWHDKAPDWESRLEKTTTSIIQQIDSLAAIASAFSDFAKFPAPANEKIEINHLIKEIVDLFTPQTEFSISFSHPETPLFVFADRKQITRVMVNLLNNAIQAIPADRNGQIDIIVDSSEQEIHIYVKDNGIGIPDQQKSRIFSPNFTTKSGGAGLGLAMVKNIINNANGSISFTSDPYGTIFEIHLPSITSET